MSHDPKAHRWLLEWSDDSGDPDHDIRATADTVEEARAAIDRILTGVTWTPEVAREFGGDQTEPAYTALLRETFDGEREKMIQRREKGDGVPICPIPPAIERYAGPFSGSGASVEANLGQLCPDR